MYDVIYEAEIALCNINKLPLQLKITKKYLVRRSKTVINNYWCAFNTLKYVMNSTVYTTCVQCKIKMVKLFC
jgi:hypothetical protein